MRSRVFLALKSIACALFIILILKYSGDMIWYVWELPVLMILFTFGSSVLNYIGSIRESKDMSSVAVYYVRS